MSFTVGFCCSSQRFILIYFSIIYTTHTICDVSINLFNHFKCVNSTFSDFSSIDCTSLKYKHILAQTCCHTETYLTWIQLHHERNDAIYGANPEIKFSYIVQLAKLKCCIKPLFFEIVNLRPKIGTKLNHININKEWFKMK